VKVQQGIAWGMDSGGRLITDRFCTCKKAERMVCMHERMPEIWHQFGWHRRKKDPVPRGDGTFLFLRRKAHGTEIFDGK